MFNKNLSWRFVSLRFLQSRKYYQIYPKIRNIGYVFFRAVPFMSFAYYLSQSRTITCAQYQKQRLENRVQQTIKQSSSIIANIGSFLSHLIRLFHLLVIFMPVIVLFPLKGWIENYWLDCFVKAVERAGVVWIKAFQYMSHRRDIIGIEMAEKFVHLRENAPLHTFEETKKYFKESYRKEISQIFQQFDTEPIASGSVGQVYRAQYKGKKVAVKVRHPGVEKYIERDLNLLFSFSRFLSLFSQSFYVPISHESMKKTLVDQIDFTVEKQNLLVFNKLFKNEKNIKFPIPFEQDTHPTILVETFAEGVPITYYQSNDHSLNAVIARLGAQTFFDMLMKHNFIHADGHGGNIIVEVKQKTSSFFADWWDYIKEKLNQLEESLIQSNLQSQLLKKLYHEGRKQGEKVRKVLRECKQKVVITVIDVGMVITLNEVDRKNFIMFLESVVKGNSRKCADMIYDLSRYEGKQIQRGMYPKYLIQLQKLFSVLDQGNLDDLPGVELFGGTLSLIRDNNMSLEGQFATLLTNMLVLQGMAKNIDPDINILKVAIPYFKYLEFNQKNQPYCQML